MFDATLARGKNIRPYLAGALVMLIGAGAAAVSFNYGVGSLQEIGPGFFPCALGVILCLLGLAIVLTASTGAQEAQEPLRADLRGWACIIAGPVLFIVLGKYFGLAPAIFGCVFAAALGDRTSTLKQAALLALSVTVLGAVLFSLLLRVPFPLLRWPAP